MLKLLIPCCTPYYFHVPLGISALSGNKTVNQKEMKVTCFSVYGSDGFIPGTGGYRVAGALESRVA